MQIATRIEKFVGTQGDDVEPKWHKNKVSAVACNFCGAFVLFPGSRVSLGQR